MLTKWILIVATALMTGMGPSPAEDSGSLEFRIETDIFVNGQEQPVSENLTLFTEQKVYDFQMAKNSDTPVEVVIYDFSNKSFVLLDPSRKFKYEIDPEELKYFVNSLRQDESMKSKMPFMFDPQLDEQYDSESGWLSLASSRLEYRCKGKSPSDHDAAMKHYYEFIDQYAKLNVTDPHKLPPFARLELNKSIVSRKWMPTTVEMNLDLSNENGSRKINAKSKHYVIWKLSKKDASRIDSAKKMLNEFESVGLEKYRKLQSGDTTPTKR